MTDQWCFMAIFNSNFRQGVVDIVHVSDHHCGLYSGASCRSHFVAATISLLFTSLNVSPSALIIVIIAIIFHLLIYIF